MDATDKQFLTVLRRAARNPRFLHAFLRDLLTPREYREFVKRWQIVKLLTRGTTQREIAKRLRVSIATVTRGSRVLLEKRGGFNQMLRFLRER
jgi:Trp operon repressor